MNFNQAEFLTSYGLSSQLPKSDELEFAFAGRSNVGKSSLINKLFNRKALAKVSAVPGKTATINFYRVENVHFVDLPGYGYAKVAKSEKERWAALIEKYFGDDRNLGLVFQLVDMRHPPTKLDIDMTNYLIECELPFAVVLTKADKLNKTQTKERLAAIRKELPYGEQLTILPCSSQTGAGIEEMRELIEEIVSQEMD
ncbi:Probable GTP-binding protein EngB [uncultured Ruminococcus sp.]|uniref:Probable GTP-binding protein EngB n=1 Tax=Massiliimalia timonensis TaxID=1987501 RepID=A0A8J6P3F4_9FIRM|nr:ribosome biogenesis GTP-binding protein YihA/YsxC [Massiliimalia timonensis]MBC8611961.1 YihA family ribosome biogenesis GTP-binding protein [Massiliimalia timonensis]SCG95962.1 Probable GTP-binding protein EngB [uncultured Clostridium sp.]SCH91913.1 Probable GTP-binding protein EngB [uncultured Ruminococcus sp.]